MKKIYFSFLIIPITILALIITTPKAYAMIVDPNPIYPTANGLANLESQLGITSASGYKVTDYQTTDLTTNVYDEGSTSVSQGTYYNRRMTLSWVTSNPFSSLSLLTIEFQSSQRIIGLRSNLNNYNIKNKYSLYTYNTPGGAYRYVFMVYFDTSTGTSSGMDLFQFETQAPPVISNVTTYVSGPLQTIGRSTIYEWDQKYSLYVRDVINQNNYQLGYDQGRHDFGHQVSPNVYQTADEWGDVRYQEGYDEGGGASVTEAYNKGYDDGELAGRNDVFYANFDKWIVPAIIVTLVLGGFIFIKNKRNEV